VVDRHHPFVELLKEGAPRRCGSTRVDHLADW
jgi:hypothetical protein